MAHAKVANALATAGDRAGARQTLLLGRDIIALLVERHPDWAAWKQDLAWFDAELATLENSADSRSIDTATPDNSRRAAASRPRTWWSRLLGL